MECLASNTLPNGFDSNVKFLLTKEFFFFFFFQIYLLFFLFFLQITGFKEAFNMIDQNHDGFIDKEDLHDMLASLGKASALIDVTPH